jgi:hypothetical protein
MKTFLEYMQYRDRMDEDVGRVNYDDALKFVYSQLGISDKPKLKDEDIQDTLSALLSDYPEDKRKSLLDQVATTFPDKKSQVSSLFVDPKSKTVNDLVQALVSSKGKEEDSGDFADEDDSDSDDEPESSDSESNEDRSDPF